jgi:hypothetical protein
MYGSKKLQGMKRVQGIDLTIFTNQAKLIVEHVRDFIDMKCKKIFKFKDCMKILIKNRMENDKLLLSNLQGNIIQHKYHKIKKVDYVLKLT